jgi:L-asparaginase
MVTLLATGGTIAMNARGPDPALDATALLDGIPGLRAGSVRARTISTLPSAHVSLEEALTTARAAVGAATESDGVVVTHGTDTLEEAAFLTDVMYGGRAPIVFTGAIRLATAPGADGPANLHASLSVAAAPAARGLGALVCFGGEVHAARWARKIRTTSPLAFASPTVGPLGWIDEGRLTMAVRPLRHPPLDVKRLDARVPMAIFGIGDRGEWLPEEVDGLVVAIPGAGHTHPELLERLDALASRIPVVAVSRPETGRILEKTYGYAGSEQDLHRSHLITAGPIGALAARILLLAALGADADPVAVFASRG